MSVEAMALVLHHSKASGTAKVILLGIANHEGDGGAWPSLATLAKYANVTVRNVRKHLRDLETSGEIRCGYSEGGQASTPGWQRPNLYRVLVRCPHDCDRTTAHRVSGPTPPVASDRGPRSPVTPHPRSPVTPEPSLEPSGEPSVKNNLAHRSAASAAVIDLQVFEDVWLDTGGDPQGVLQAYEFIRDNEGARFPGAWAKALDERDEFLGWVGNNGPTEDAT